MPLKLNKLLSSTRWSIGYIILIPIIVCIFVVWNGLQRINEFEQAHYRIAESTTAIVAREISKRIINQQRLLGIFAKKEERLIHNLAQDSDNEIIKSQLNKKVAESFPNYFAVSIANREGIPIIDDFDELIGGLCLEDLKHIAHGHPQPIRIHQNAQAYHIDIIVPWNHTGGAKEDDINGGLLFVSFIPDFLFQLLELSSTPRHELMLINNDIKNLIEITEQGTRKSLKRENFRLSEEEQQRLLHSTFVENSVWNLGDFREATLFSEYRKNIINFNLLILIFFILGSVLMVALLLRTEKKRVHAEQTKEEMFSLFNHDLRAPLTSIFGFLEIYTQSDICEKKSEQCQHFASRAYDNALIMREIVDDILDVQKMEAGEMSFDFAEIEIISLVKDTVEMNAQYALKHNVELKILNDENVIYIKADARRINQALTNLLSNAIKYSPEHEAVTVKVVRQNAEVIISVSDNGPGIEKDFQTLVFNKFAQSKSKLTRSVGGTGLGLAIVKHIIDSHNGSVSFVCEENKGTTFKISIPFSMGDNV